MIRLSKSLESWGTTRFIDVLKQELAQIDMDDLPLQRGLSTSSIAIDGTREVMIIGVADEGDLVRVKAGIFYSGVVGGCSCADDPTPVDENNEYCEVQLDIDKRTAQTSVTLLTE